MANWFNVPNALTLLRIVMVGFMRDFSRVSAILQPWFCFWQLGRRIFWMGILPADIT